MISINDIILQDALETMEMMHPVYGFVRYLTITLMKCRIFYTKLLSLVQTSNYI